MQAEVVRGGRQAGERIAIPNAVGPTRCRIQATAPRQEHNETLHNESESARLPLVPASIVLPTLGTWALKMLVLFHRLQQLYLLVHVSK